MDWDKLAKSISETKNMPVPAARMIIPDTEVMILSDAHIPYCNESLIYKALEDIKRLGITCVCWAGDTMDNHQFSHYGVSDHTIDIEDVNKQVRTTIEVFARALGPDGYQVISQGNHDARWIKKLDDYGTMLQLYSSVGLGALIDEKLVVISESPTVEAVELFYDDDLHTQWLIQHPGKYNSQPFANAEKAVLHEQKNVATAHSHHLGARADFSGRFWVVETGGLYDYAKFTYPHMSPANMRAMMSGYVTLSGAEGPRIVEGRMLGPRAVALSMPGAPTFYAR